MPTPARDPKTSPWVHRQPRKALDQRTRLSWRTWTRTGQTGTAIGSSGHACNQRISSGRERKLQEAAWQAEADRRNAAEDDQERQYASMDEGERSAYHLGVVRGLQAAQEQAGEEEARKQPQKAVVSG